MKILVVGGGGREHALTWKLAQSPKVEKIFVAPGNAGTAHEDKTENVPIDADDIAALLGFARENKIDLTIIGPEGPLVLGIVDRFKAANLRCFGPTRAAAQLEGSKSYAKDFLARHRIPTAGYNVSNDYETTKRMLADFQFPCVIKADGLAAGKGVVIAQTKEEALTATANMQLSRSLGAAGQRVVLEEFLRGEEASFIAIVEGEHVLPLATSQDHKARDDGDHGPNTGGMGAYSPAPVVTPAIHQRIMRDVIEPTVRALVQDGHPYVGFLYAGLMIQDGAPKVLEFNCRFGDPETQPIMMRLRSDLVDLIEEALNGNLHQVDARWDPRAALGVVMAAGGYPDRYEKGDVIAGLPLAPDPACKVFHAGTSEQNGHTLTHGGRVLCVTALGATVSAAQQRAYETVRQIRWNNVYYRNDIGFRAIARERS